MHGGIGGVIMALVMTASGVVSGIWRENERQNQHRGVKIKRQAAYQSIAAARQRQRRRHVSSWHQRRGMAKISGGGIRRNSKKNRRIWRRNEEAAKAYGVSRAASAAISKRVTSYLS